jgi:uncharacterized protein (TIRG00374 family)
MLKSARFWVGVIVSVVCLYFAFQGIQFDKLLEALRDFNYLWLIPASLVFLVSYLARVFRWQLLFAPQEIRFTSTFHALNIGYFLSNILPARLGDIVRAYLIGEFENVSKARALSTVVVERLSDGLATVLLLVFSAIFVPSIPDVAKQGALVVAASGIGGVLFLIALSFQKERGLALVRRLTAPIPILQNPKLWGAVESLIDGFAILRSPRPLLGVGAWALIAWVTGAIMWWIVMIGSNLQANGARLPLHAALLTMTITALAVIVPSSPGYIGVFHFGVQVTLSSIYGVDKSAALSYAFIIHAFTYIWLIVLGIYSMWHEGLTYQKLQNIQASNPAPASEQAIDRV